MNDPTLLGARHRASHIPWISILMLLAAPPAAAQEWGGALGFGSDNIYRGRSLTIDQPAWLADLHYAFATDWIAGIGASAQRAPRQTEAAQLTAYINRRWLLDDDWATSVGFMHYASPWDRYSHRLSYDEINAAVSYLGRWRASIAVSPNSPGILFGPEAKNDPAAWLELTYHQSLIGRLSADVGVGYADLSHTVFPSYTYSSIGLSYGIGDAYFYLVHVWSGAPNEPYPQNPYPISGESNSHWTASVVWSF